MQSDIDETKKSEGDEQGTPGPSSAPPVPKELLHGLHHQKSPAVEVAPEVKSTDGTAKAASAAETEPVGPALGDDEKTDKVVDEIVAEESDELLDAEDAARAEANPERPTTFGQKLKGFLSAWWHNKWARWGTIIGVLAVLGVVFGVPTSRYAVLNTVGVRSSVTVTALDNSTAQPLKNVTVQIAGQSAATDIHGVAKVQHVRLGKQTMKLKRIAFAPMTQTITVGWGSNPLDAISLKPAGTQYVIDVTDYLSGKGVAQTEASSGDADATANSNGKIVLTIDAPDDTGTIPVTLSANGYRNEQITLNVTTQTATKVQLVTARKEIFVSKQSGKYDLYKIDVDGKNKQLLLAGTGLETDNISLVENADDSEVALVSTRDNMRDQDGFLLSALALVKVSDGTVLTIDHAEHIQPIDWIGDRIIYDAASAGASAANPERYRLMSYDYVASKRSQLATANEFNAVLSAQGYIYFAVSSTDPKAQADFFRIKPDNTDRQMILNQEVWSAFRSDYNTLNLQTPGGWYSYSLTNGQSQKLQSVPALVSRTYVDSPDAKHSLWIDTRDGKGVLLNFDGKQDQTLQTQAGLTYPVRWLDGTTIIYRVADQQSSADYALSTAGGAAKKITDVTNTYGFAQAY
ncbi:MAG TPA: hypothetical protein VHT70_00990 [Candidatus Saccharimonadales bacterium]|nr:hypothetical protein [Candidatus Saccharimonadales bacterium]